MLLTGHRQAGDRVRSRSVARSSSLTSAALWKCREGGLLTQLARFEGKQAYLVC
jgi:hypothetical protein